MWGTYVGTAGPRYLLVVDRSTEDRHPAHTPALIAVDSVTASVSVCLSVILSCVSYSLSRSLTRALLSNPHPDAHARTYTLFVYRSLFFSLLTGIYTHTRTHAHTLPHSLTLSCLPALSCPCVVDPLGRDTSRNITLVELLDPLGPTLSAGSDLYLHLHTDQPTYLHLLTTNSSPIPPLGANFRSVLSVPPNPRRFFPTITPRVCDSALSTKLPRSILEASPGNTRIQFLDRLGPTGPGSALRKRYSLILPTR